MIMRKKFLIKKKGWTNYNSTAGEKFEELNLYVINSESFYTIFDLVPNLSLAERYSLCISYFKKEILTKYEGVTLLNNAEIINSRENALKKICHGILRNEVHIIFKKDYVKDKYMKHSKFREYMDDYLAEELLLRDKIAFENHMLACDFCGFLFLINRDIVEILDKCGEELFEDIKDKESKDSTIFRPKEGEQVCGEMSNESSNYMGGALESLREKIRKYPKQLGFALIFLQDDSQQFIQTLLRLLRR